MILLKVVVLSILIFQVIAQCEEDDMLIGDLCYSFSTVQLNFTDARSYCHSANKNLAVIHSSYQNSYLAANMRINLKSSVSYFWIGLSRATLNSSFYWDDGTPLHGSNFGSITKNIFVAESTLNGRWETQDGTKEKAFVCSYIPRANDTTLLPQAAVETKPTISCLLMIDMQSSGIDQAAINTYQSYFNFAQTVARKLSDQSELTGFIDHFGYSAGLDDHQDYPKDSYANLKDIAFPIDGTDDDIDLDLRDVDSTLTTAQWTPPGNDQTCMIFFSNSPVAMYRGNSLQSTYDSFTKVLGVLVGAETSIPGLIDPIFASTLSDADAEAVVQKLLESLLSN